jgi:hypothetical protein
MPRGPLPSNGEGVATAYLRAAHAYMLISMPTGTSMIFGVFQAILALSFVWRTVSILARKLLPNENFASEIFLLQRKRNSQFCAASCQTKAD